MARRFLLTAAVTLTLSAPIAMPTGMLPSVFGQEVPPEVQNSKNSAVGTVNADAVYVRSGAGDNYYPTVKVNKGTELTIVGVKFDWLKVLPPEGSFCYVAKAYVDKGENGTGKANRDDVNVRAGSSLNAMKTTVQGRLSQGQEVKILDEQDEYYKIAPPPDAFVYVKKDFVDLKQVMPQVAGTPTAGTVAPDAGTAAIPLAGVAATTADPNAAPSTQPTGVGPDAVAAAPTTQPTAEIEFDKLETEFSAASGKPIEQQPVTELLASYKKLIADPQLPESMRRIADFRTNTLKARAEAREQFIAVQKEQEAAKQKSLAAKAEAEEITQQIKKNDVVVYTAVGTLRTSSLQQGAAMLYRLTDPQTGRTVCYIRSDDAKFGGMIGQFIGVKGQIGTDPQLNLRVVTPSETAAVDPNQVFRGVGAQIVPPSLLPQAAEQASSTDK